MASCQILWKTLWENMLKRSEKLVEKPAKKSENEYFACSVWWKIVRFCEFLFGFSGFVRVCRGKLATDKKSDNNRRIHDFHIAYNYYY